MDWIWSALHLDDGTHLHGVNIRIPGAPAFSIGYVQGADRKVTELQTVTSAGILRRQRVTAERDIEPRSR